MDNVARIAAIRAEIESIVALGWRMSNSKQAKLGNLNRLLTYLTTI